MFLKSGIKKVIILTMVVALCLCSGFDVEALAASKKSGNVTSTKVDSNYFRTVKSNGNVWYVAENNPSLIYEGRTDIHITASGKSVGVYSYTAGEFDYTYERFAVMNFNTGVTTLLDEAFSRISAYCDEYDIFIAQAYRDQGYLPNGVKSGSLSTYAYFTYDGKRLTNIDYLYASPFYNGYALVEYYKNYERYFEIINTKGESVAEVNISSIYDIHYSSYAYILAYDKNEKFCYVDVANGGALLTKEELGEFIQLNNVAAEYRDRDALTAFIKKQASQWKTFKYLGKNLFYVKDSDDKGSIVNSKGKVVLTDGSEEKVCDPESMFQFLCPTAHYIDGEIYLSKVKADTKSENDIFAVYDSTGKQIISFDKKYQMIMTADAGFLCGYNLNSLNRYLGQSFVDTKGNVVVDLPWKNGTLYTFYNGEYINPEHDYYDTASLPAGQTFVISDRYKAVTNTIKSDLLDKSVGEKAKKLAETDWGDGTKGIDPSWNANAKTYSSFLKKTEVPAFHTWNLYLTMNASPVVTRPKAKAGVINVNSKGKEIDYLSILKKNSISLSSVTSTTAYVTDLEWKAVDDAAEYLIQYQQKQYNSYEKTTIDSVTVKDATAISITTEETGKYRFRIKALDSKGHVVAPVSNWVEISVAKVEVVKVLEDPMKYFTSIDTSVAGKVTLNWTALDGAYTYRIAYRRATESGNGTIKNVENKTTYTVTPKYAGEDYVFRILAWDKKGNVVLQWTDWTSPITTAAKKNSGGTDKASNSISFKSIESTVSKKATLSWEPVEGAAKYYIAAKRSTKSGNGSTVEVTSTTATITLKYSDVDYVFRVKAVDAGGKVIRDWSDWSDSVHIMK